MLPLLGLNIEKRLLLGIRSRRDSWRLVADLQIAYHP
jgi:hypothetical protein